MRMRMRKELATLSNQANERGRMDGWIRIHGTARHGGMIMIMCLPINTYMIQPNKYEYTVVCLSQAMDIIK
eukprot:scaffold64255_cov27-Attheya_sp.AAC.2